MAIILAVLYFGLIELLLIDSSRELAAARRYRAQVIAQTMAENGAELAAQDLLARPLGIYRPEPLTFEEATAAGELQKASNTNFVLMGAGETKGLVRTKAAVKVIGHLDGGQIYIDYAIHP